VLDITMQYDFTCEKSRIDLPLHCCSASMILTSSVIMRLICSTGWGDNCIYVV